jgi:sulfate adenylyltransferase subunit 1 (EFTu-like GTPase family)
VLDSFRVERQKGMTIDTTRAVVAMSGIMYEFIDIPGHEELIKNRLTGASNASCGIWVVAADEGITREAREHALLARFLRLEHLLVVVNKMDAVGFSPERFNLVSRDIQKLLKKIHVKYVTVIPISALDGGNLLRKSVHLRWFKGPSLQQAMRSFQISARTKSKAFIMTVQDVYRGEYIVGQVVQGTVAKGDLVRILPEDHTCRVKEITIVGGNANLEIEKYADLVVARGDVITTFRKNLFRKKVSAECIFLGPKGGKLTVESHFRESKVRTRSSRNRTGVFSEIDLVFDKPLFITDQFVLKNNRQIVSVCRAK